MPKEPKKTRKGNFTTPFTKIRLKSKANDLLENISNTSSYEGFSKEYEGILSKKWALRITFKDDPELFYISFQDKSLGRLTARAKGYWEACKYFRESFHPDFLVKRDYDVKLKNAVSKRMPMLDKYSLKGKIPIPELMKHLNVSFHCSVCGKETFTYEDYKVGKCFIIEGEGDMNVFTQGLILCYNCYKKYTGKR